MNWKSFLLNISILTIMQFPILMGIAIYHYPGGTIHHPEWESYSMTYNYFSDLGRTRTFDGSHNEKSHWYFKTSLTLVGVGMMAFFIVLPTLFKNTTAKSFSALALFLGFAAAFCYIGIGYVPWNESYWGHRYFVVWGFICFLGTSFALLAAILAEPDYPKKYAVVLTVFCIMAFLQICIMLNGPRAYRSNEALLSSSCCPKGYRLCGDCEYVIFSGRS